MFQKLVKSSSMLLLISALNVYANEAAHVAHEVAEIKEVDAVVIKERPHEAHKREIGAVGADSSKKFLINGNKRFTTKRFRNDGVSSDDLKKLSSGQKPHAIVLSCSDSRVPPEVVFDQKLGEIFVIRTAGQAIDSSVIASIEYAVAHLGTNLIVVMGHESCGAVKAALSTLSGGDAGSPSLNKLVADIHPRLARFSRIPASAGVINESWSNVNGVASDLAAKSEIIQSAVESGELKIQKALYHLGTGSVEWK
jgi:carbonic anhydrase